MILSIAHVCQHPHQTFWENLEISVQLHNIKKVIVINHRDCGGANGEAYFWDVTDPSKMVIIDTITVDARTVNDVKVSEDGRVGIISREGASNRKNGFIVLDVTDPYNVKITAEYNDDMTGGVHNVFIYDNHVYAVNNGRKYDIINIEDPSNPFRVGVYELGTPGHSIHDVWVEDGIAYSLWLCPLVHTPCHTLAL